jgi:hypothetical protein
MSSGGSNGFSVTRAGMQITLSRVDIYRLSKFYTEWEDNRFAQTTVPASFNTKPLLGFNDIIAKQDKIPVKDSTGTTIDTTPTKHSIVKHSKILYMNTTNVVNSDSETYWLNRIQTNNNPKLVSNSSPIPLNLRTPIFDENMSTASYNQEETYLFPYGYYMMDLYGYQGDGVDRVLGGKSYAIQVDDQISLQASKIAMGSIPASMPYKTLTRRVSGNFSTVWGFDTHARQNYETVGGYGSVASGSSAISIGYDNYAAGDFSADIGGAHNDTVGAYSGILSGSSNATLAQRSVILGGDGNTIGGLIYQFSVKKPSDISTYYSNCAPDVTNVTRTFVGGDHFNVPKNISAVDIYVGDDVLIWNLTTSYNGVGSNGFSTPAGDVFPVYRRKVSSVSAIDNKNTMIVVTNAIPNTDFVDGGRIARISMAGSSTDFGTHSVVAGIGNVSMGIAQAVFGKYNQFYGGYRSKQSASLIVGAGTSATARGNTLEVYSDGIIATATPSADPNEEAFVGIEIDSTGVRGQAHNSGIYISSYVASLQYIEYLSYINYLDYLVTSGVGKYSSIDLDGTIKAVSRDSIITSVGAITANEISNKIPLLGNNMYSNAYMNMISDGYINTIAGSHYYVTGLDSVEVYTPGNMYLNFGKLNLGGDTSEALTTTAGVEAFEKTFDDLSTLSKSGFFYSQYSKNTAWTNGVHLLNSTFNVGDYVAIQQIASGDVGGGAAANPAIRVGKLQDGVFTFNDWEYLNTRSTPPSVATSTWDSYLNYIPTAFNIQCYEGTSMMSVDLNDWSIVKNPYNLYAAFKKEGNVTSFELYLLFNYTYITDMIAAYSAQYVDIATYTHMRNCKLTFNLPDNADIYNNNGSMNGPFISPSTFYMDQNPRAKFGSRTMAASFVYASGGTEITLVPCINTSINTYTDVSAAQVEMNYDAFNNNNTNHQLMPFGHGSGYPPTPNPLILPTYIFRGKYFNQDLKI